MDGPDFSEDDLINDYVDDYEEPMQESEYWEAMAEEQDEEDKQSNEVRPSGSATTAEQNTNDNFAPTNSTMNSATNVQASSALEQNHESQIPVRTLLSQPRKDDHLYSFER